MWVKGLKVALDIGTSFIADNGYGL